MSEEIKFTYKDDDGNNIKLGDKVKILHVVDDSGSAIDLFGVEPHLDAWVPVFYIDHVIGEVKYDEESLMIIIDAGKRKYPLSKSLREIRTHQIFENLTKEDIGTASEDYGIKEITPEAINGYLKIVK